MIGLWPGASVLAEDLGIKANVVRQWWRRGSIPARHWHRLIRAAARRRIEGIDEGVLSTLAAIHRSGR